MKTLYLIALSLMLFSCNKGNRQSNDPNSTPQNIQVSEDIDYVSIGNKIALETQMILGKNLMSAIKSGGSEFAVAFCNTKAITLTDSMAIVLNANIKRVTDKPRNADNQADEVASSFIQELKEKLQNGESPTPKIIELGEKMVGYYPIITSEACLQCHGKKEVNINLKTLEKINKYYAHDKATDYNVGEIRGLWVVEMSK